MNLFVARQRALPLILGPVVLLIALLSPRLVPYNMDEFVHYHSLGCLAFPLSRALNHFTEGCDKYTLTLPFTHVALPLRSYIYIGSSPIIPFYPFWRLIGQPIAVRVQGALFFLAAVYLTRRVTRCSLPSALLACLLFPLYLVSFVVDTGPVGLSMVCLLGTMLLLQLVVESTHPARRVIYAAGAGLAAFLGIYTKLVFAWTVPALVLYTLRLLADRKARRGWMRDALAYLVLSAAICGGLTLFLLLAKDPTGRHYARVRHEGETTLSAHAFGENAMRLGEYAVNGAAIAPKTLELQATAIDALPGALALLLLGVGYWWRKDTRGQVVVLLSMAGSVFVIISTQANARWPHHFVYALVFVLLVLALVLESLRHTPYFMLCAVTTLAYWATIVGRLPSARIRPDTDQAKDELLAALRNTRIGSETVQVHVDWGTYYINHLFGPRDQAVAYIYNLQEREPDLQEIKAVALALGRGVLLYTSRPAQLRQAPAIVAALGRPIHEYHVGNWAALRYLR
jgi:hypothetical protein